MLQEKWVGVVNQMKLVELQYTIIWFSGHCNMLSFVLHYNHLAFLNLSEKRWINKKKGKYLYLYGREYILFKQAYLPAILGQIKKYSSFLNN